MSYNLVNPTTGDLTRVAGGTLYADNPIGSIIPFGSSTIPSGYLLCNGQAVSRTTYSELFAAIGTAFGTGDGSTTFNIPDLREATTKGAGLSGKSNNHYDADGVALGEFVEDRLQAHTHSNKTGSSTAGSEEWTMFATSQVLSGTAQTDYGVMGRFGNTTEVKAVGVNYIIKAKHVGIPSDFIDAIDEAITDTTVDTVANGNMHPVTSNAVYDALADRLNGMNMTITTSNGNNFSTRIRLKSSNYVSIYMFGDQGIYTIGIGADTSALTVNTLLGSNPPVSPTLTLNPDGSYQLVYTYATGVYSRQLIIS